MRVAWSLVAILCCISMAGAQTTIEWSRDRKLARSDFRGRVPARAVPAALSSLYIETEWTCEEGALAAKARATFDPALSWWREGSQNVWSENGGRAPQGGFENRVPASERERQLLEHEQVHFDLAELAVRKLRKRFDELRQVCREPGGTDAVVKAIAQADEDLQKEQARYDSDCAYGVNTGAQKRWAQRVAKELTE
jgi:hypothetical protein